MSLQKDDTGTLSFGDGSKARVKIVRIDINNWTPNDYWFRYLDGETNRQLTYHDDTESFPDMFPMPELLVDMFFTKDVEAKSEPEMDDYEQKLQEYLDREMNPEDHAEARRIFKRLVELKSKEQVIREYFS